MIAAKIGHRYWIITLKILFLRWNCSAVSVTSSSMLLQHQLPLDIRETGCNRCDRHHDRVCQKIKEIKELHANDLHTRQRTIAKSRKDFQATA